MNDKHYIGGQWVTPMSTQAFTVINPANEEIITRVSAGNAEDIDSAVCAARLAFDEGSWPRLTGADRAGYLRKITVSAQPGPN
jgi:betaine-aldehyde dehydrogenase